MEKTMSTMIELKDVTFAYPAEEGKTPMQCAEESAMYVLKNI